MNYLTTRAEVSACGQYRHSLTRRWVNPHGNLAIVFIGLNPSTADGELDDPTIRRCVDFANGLGGSRLTMINLFDFRATQPADMRKQNKPISEHNEEHVIRALINADIVVAAWGNGGRYRGAGLQMRKLAHDKKVKLHHLGLTMDAQPKHPLYLAKSTPLSEWVITQ